MESNDLELVKVKKNDEGNLVVSGRDLHRFLEIGTQYKKWMDRMIEYGFIENVDFAVLVKNVYDETAFGGKRKITDHIIKIEMAKEIGMIQRNEKGKQIRKYFIKVEEEYKKEKQNKLPQTYLEALKELVVKVEENEKLKLENKKQQETITVQTQTIKEYEPKVSYYDIILSSNELLTITLIAKDYGMSGKEMNKKLNEMKIQYKLGNNWLLYQDYSSFGYTKTKTTTLDNGKTVTNMRWTQKGRLFLYEKLKSIGILPLIEQE